MMKKKYIAIALLLFLCSCGSDDSMSSFSPESATNSSSSEGNIDLNNTLSSSSVAETVQNSSSSRSSFTRFNEKDSVIVDSEGNVYPVVKIGKLWWTTKNSKIRRDGGSCYQDKDENCEEYGVLYSFNEASRGCSFNNGFRIPTKNEFEQLLEAAGESKEERSVNLRSTEWSNGKDALGFSAKEGKYGMVGIAFWSSTMNPYSSYESYFLFITDDSADLYGDNRKRAFYVRCVYKSEE